MESVKDIKSVTDIQRQVDAFYTKVLDDEVIGHFFTRVVPLDLDVHLPILYRFWENMLLDRPVYQGNPMLKHLAMDAISPMEPQHFARWLELWKETVDTYFAGELAEKAKYRAEQIALLMQHKVDARRKGYH